MQRYKIWFGVAICYFVARHGMLMSKLPPCIALPRNCELPKRSSSMQAQSAELKLADVITQDCSNLITRVVTHACIVAHKPYLLELEPHEVPFAAIQHRADLPPADITSLKGQVGQIAMAYSQALEQIFKEGLPAPASLPGARSAARSASATAGSRSAP
ncbi:MAG: hypothetical protein EON92_12465, partial [Burkholderiales bacterium]